MNGQYNQDRWNPQDEGEKTGNFVIERPVNSDPVTDRSQVDESEMQETSVREAAAAVGPQTGAAQEKAALNEKVIHLEPVSVKAETMDPFISREEAEKLRTRWNEIQIKFVDEPHSAVQQADALVTELIEKITRMIADEHSSVVSQWDQSVDASTEDLRTALQRFRSFFNRLVA